MSVPFGANAGLGVPSLAVAHMGAAEVVVTDVASGIPLLNENIALKYGRLLSTSKSLLHERP